MFNYKTFKLIHNFSFQWIYLFIYLKTLPNMVGQPQQLEANYSGPNNIT